MASLNGNPPHKNFVMFSILLPPSSMKPFFYFREQTKAFERSKLLGSLLLLRHPKNASFGDPVLRTCTGFSSYHLCAAYKKKNFQRLARPMRSSQVSSHPVNASRLHWRSASLFLVIVRLVVLKAVLNAKRDKCKT